MTLPTSKEGRVDSHSLRFLNIHLEHTPNPLTNTLCIFFRNSWIHLVKSGCLQRMLQCGMLGFSYRHSFPLPVFRWNDANKNTWLQPLSFLAFLARQGQMLEWNKPILPIRWIYPPTQSQVANFKGVIKGSDSLCFLKVSLASWWWLSASWVVGKNPKISKLTKQVNQKFIHEVQKKPNQNIPTLLGN